ncbi:hypothetical protein D9611_010204 [Ephemerocybe angulata]|uniref:Inactive metallocarboxypeptidase ECM14 n=1 Tax=Ephemerocybe angulata TaxID=980116 RepID=A0A8H5EV92_9AGAR|nr:hypothetical protein D9611_010204 [Tulosesus angulatus]
MKFLFLLAAIAAVASGYEQQVLQEQRPAGTLRRFNVSSRGEASTIMTVARRNDLDVWGVTRSHIDIYWPSNEGSKLPADLKELPHTSTTIPRWMGGHHQTAGEPDWDLSTLNATFHEDYHPLEQADEFMRQLTTQFPNTTQLTRIGLTAEGRDLFALTVSKEGNVSLVEDKKKKKKKKKKHPVEVPKLNIVVVGAQHAREWIATSTSLYLAHALAVNSSDIHSLLDVFNFHIIPSPNPDGYAYTWTNERYWYKNRQTLAAHVPCKGLDTNRNWGYQWHHEPVEGALHPDVPVDPCSHWYPGNRPFQAPEVNDIANYVATIPDLIGFLDLRSYGQMISTPYSYSCERYPKDIEDQTEAAYGAAQAIKTTHGVHFEAGRVCDNLYEAPGNILDWMYSRAGAKYSYAVHLRDTGTYGFSLPAKYIRPVGEETAGMVSYLAKFIAAKFKRKL